MRNHLALLILLTSGCSSAPDCGEPRTYSKADQNGAITPLGKEVRAQLSADLRATLVAQVDEIEITDTGCWFELKSANQLRLHDPKSSRDVEFEQIGGVWRFTKVLYPIGM